MTAAVTIPETPAQLEEWLNDLDPAKMAASIKSGEFQNQIKAYAAKVEAKDKSIAQQVKEQVQLSMHDFLERNGADPKRTPVDLNYKADPTTPKGRHARNPKAVGAALDGMFGSLGEYLAAIWHKGNPTAETREKLQKIRDYSEKIPSEGGFLVPEEFRSELLVNALEDVIVRPRARIIPMSSETLRLPKIDETSRVSSVYGGIVVYRTEEGAELVESAAAFSAVKLEATKQTALAHVTNELIKDLPGFTAFVDQTFSPAMAFYEDLDYLTATGAGEPLGALNASNRALIVVTAETGQPAATVVYENVLRMYARMLPSSMARAVWLASPDTFVELATMALNVGTGGSAVWLVNANGAPQLTLLGRPVIMTEKAPSALGTQGDLSLVDFGMYLVGDRQMATAASSEHVKFTSDKTTFRVIARNDGRPWMDSPITPHNNSATLSAFVQLATR
jgi:HK97 family phage major capsid protein